MAVVNEFVVKDAGTIRDDYLRVIKNGLIRRGIAAPVVDSGTDWYLSAQALANELAVIGANAIVKNDAQMPDTATGDDLGRIAAMFGLSKQAAGGSIGDVLVSCSATTPIPTGAQLTDAVGARYEVTVGGNYANGARVPIQAISTGAATNHAAGDVLQWASAPPYCEDRVTVASGGLVNGIDAETDEVLRTRLLSLLQTPPGSGNWEHVAEVAEESDPRVQKCFVYPAIQGPATADYAVVAAPTTTSKSRVIASAIVSGTVNPYVRGKLPEHASLTGTTVVDVNADVAYGLSLPEAPTANPPGPGGGWKNGTPWPTPNSTSTFRCTVTAVTSVTQFTVDATTSPTVSVTRIAWLSPTDWKVRSALVTNVSGTSGAYVITIDKAFTGITTGCYIWPDCTNAQAYADAALAQFALMGPGEKSTNVSALARGFRHPRPSEAWPYSLGPHLQDALSEAQEEILAVQFLHRTDGTTTLTGNGGVVNPQAPAALSDPPKQFVPRHIGFYRSP